MAANENTGKNNDKGIRPPDYLEPTLQNDGFMFPLRDGAYILIKQQAPTVAMVTMWQGSAFIAPDTGNIFAKAFRDRLSASAKDAFAEEAPFIGEDIEMVAKTLGAPGKGGKTLMDELKEAPERAVIDRIILYAMRSANFFHNSEGERFARVKHDSHYENYDIRSPKFRDWVLHEYWLREKERFEAAALEEEGALHEGPIRASMPTVPRESIVSDAIRQMSALAAFEGEEAEVYIRTAGEGGQVYIDMGDDAWRAIEVSPLEWRIVEGDEIPVRFVRPKGALPLPEPSREGSLGAIPRILNLGEGDDGRRNQALILAWLTFALTPATAASGGYPILLITGPQGAAKSHMLRILRKLVDSSKAAGSTKPQSEHDTYIDASSNWILAYDQLVTAPVWLSNVLCDLSTGGGFRTRTLYSNRDQEIFSDKRPIILAGIGNIASRPDLQDRAIPITLSRIKDSERKTDEEVHEEIERSHAEILGAILDAIAIGLAKKPQVLEDMKGKNKPRMADFAVWGVATEEALGGEAGDFMRAYWTVRKESTSVVLEEWPLTDAFMSFAMLFKGSENAWEGTASELLDKLNDRVDDDDVKRQKTWPKGASALSSQLNDYAANLEELGIVIEKGRKSSQRTRRIYYDPKHTSETE